MNCQASNLRGAFTRASVQSRNVRERTITVKWSCKSICTATGYKLDLQWTPIYCKSVAPERNSGTSCASGRFCHTEASVANAQQCRTVRCEIQVNIDPHGTKLVPRVEIWLWFIQRDSEGQKSMFQKGAFTRFFWTFSLLSSGETLRGTGIEFARLYLLRITLPWHKVTPEPKLYSILLRNKSDDILKEALHKN